jgi:hypothetical protein
MGQLGTATALAGLTMHFLLGTHTPALPTLNTLSEFN